MDAPAHVRFRGNSGHHAAPRQCLLLTQSGHLILRCAFPLSGVKRTCGLPIGSRAVIKNTSEIFSHNLLATTAPRSIAGFSPAPLAISTKQRFKARFKNESIVRCFELPLSRQRVG